MVKIISHKIYQKRISHRISNWLVWWRCVMEQMIAENTEKILKSEKYQCQKWTKFSKKKTAVKTACIHYLYISKNWSFQFFLEEKESYE